MIDASSVADSMAFSRMEMKIGILKGLLNSEDITTDRFMELELECKCDYIDAKRQINKAAAEEKKKRIEELS